MLKRSSHCKGTSFGQNIFRSDGFLLAYVADRQKELAVIKKSGILAALCEECTERS
jgi:hypothetical protein